MPRDSSGAYTLPSGNPVVDGTIIESTWANPTMSDIAVQLNNVFTRDGLLGPIAPVLFVNGTVALPGIAFQESPSTGFGRTPPSTIFVSVNGVVQQTWTSTGASFALAAGAVTTPTLFFTSDTDTGMWSPGADQIAWSTGGVQALVIDASQRVNAGLLGDVATVPFGSITVTSKLNALTGINVVSFGAGAAFFPSVGQRYARGAAGAPVSVEDADRLGAWFAGGYHQALNSGAGQWQNPAYIAVEVDGPTAAVTTGIPGRILFITQALNGVRAERMRINSVGQVSIQPVATPATDTLVVNAEAASFGINIVSAPGGLKPARMRFTSQSTRMWGMGAAIDDTFTLRDDTRSAVIFAVSNSGVVTFNGLVGINGDLIANNFSLPPANTSAGTYGLGGAGVGSKMVIWGSATPGVGRLDLYTSSGLALMLRTSVSPAVNNFYMDQAQAGQPCNLFVDGTDANVSMQVFTKGAGNILFSSGLGLNPQFAILSVAGSTRYISVGGSPAGDPRLGASAGRLNIDAPAIFTNGAAPSGPGFGPVGAVDYTYHFSTSIGHVTPAATANNRVHEFYREAVTPTSPTLHGRFLNDGYSAVSEWLQVVGGQGDNVLSVNTFALRAGGTVGMNVLNATAVLRSSGLFVTTNSASVTQLVLEELGGNGCNLKMTGVGGSKTIRVDANTLRVANNAYTVFLFNLDDVGNMTDARGLTWVRDPGATAAATIPIGGMVIGQIPGFNTNALTTINAAVNNIQINGMGTGTNLIINSGTWRTIGALSTSSNTSLFVRVG